MKAKSDCIACMFRQALNTTRMVVDDPEMELEVLRRLAGRVLDMDVEDTPAGLSMPVYEIVSELTGVKDPFRERKEESNRTALDLEPGLRKRIEKSSDPLDAALHAGAAGNIIDLGIHLEFDIEADTGRIMDQAFALSDIDAFRNEIKPGRKALFVGDNAGEIVFDKFLVGQVRDAGVDVVYSVKSGPIINDSTMDDAVMAGMPELAGVIETGSNDIGVNWDRVSDEFRREFESAYFIVAKGHGNFETCNDRPENIYFLLKAKCDMVARELGVKVGDIVFRKFN